MSISNYLRCKKRAKQLGEKRTQVLRKGAPCNVNDSGKPIEVDSESDLEGKVFFEAEGMDGAKILYRDESIERLWKNDSLRYEKGMKDFIVAYKEHSSMVMHDLIIRNRQR